jgi:predicted O-methyltransferase YrrM
MPVSAENAPGAARVAYWGRIAVLLARHPLEAIDRIRGRIELRREGQAATPPRANPDWQRVLHGSLGQAWPCGETYMFRELWKGIEQELHEAGIGHDADPAVAAALWCIARHTSTTRVVETGVARGVTSRVLLEALGPEGKLWSVDLPPLLPDWFDQVGLAVHERLRSRWRYVRGSSRRWLPRVLTGVESLDLFVHDSLHTRPTMTFELDLAWDHLRPGGFILADDVDRNEAFAEFCSRSDCEWSLVAPHQRKSHFFGLARKGGNGRHK